jgi:hypothetical protein
VELTLGGASFLRLWKDATLASVMDTDSSDLTGDIDLFILTLLWGCQHRFGCRQQGADCPSGQIRAKTFIILKKTTSAFK